MFKGARHRVEAFTNRAGALAPGLEHGATVRTVFKAKEARLPILALDSVCDTGQPIVIREPMWESIDWRDPDPRPEAIRFVIRPVLKDSDSNKVLGAYVEAARVMGLAVEDEVDPVMETAPGTLIGPDVKRQIAVDPVYEAFPAFYEQGAVAYAMAKAYGMSAADAVSLLAIRGAARDAFVAGVKPFVEELRRRGAQVGDAARDASSLVGGVIALLLAT